MYLMDTFIILFIYFKFPASILYLCQRSKLNHEIKCGKAKISDPTGVG